MAMDYETIGRLLVREHDKLWAYTWSICRDEHTVEDVLQEVAMIALRSAEKINDEQHFMAWARLACRNVAMDAQRAKKRSAVPVDAALLDALDREWARYDEPSSNHLLAALMLCMEKLSPYARQLVDLRYRAGLRSGAVAAKLRKDTNTVYVALARIHKKLAECIETTPPPKSTDD